MYKRKQDTLKYTNRRLHASPYPPYMHNAQPHKRTESRWHVRREREASNDSISLSKRQAAGKQITATVFERNQAISRGISLSAERCVFCQLSVGFTQFMLLFYCCRSVFRQSLVFRRKKEIHNNNNNCVVCVLSIDLCCSALNASSVNWTFNWK